MAAGMRSVQRAVFFSTTKELARFTEKSFAASVGQGT